jgi:hypothetical protein
MISLQHPIRWQYETLTFLLAAVLPVLFTFFWMSCNTQLPTADATDYIGTGHKIYHHFTDNGLWYGLQHFDIARGWRPIFFSVLTLPFLAMSKGDVNFAFHAVALCSVFASAIYVYLLSRLLLNRISAIVTANLICLLPLVQLPVLIFFAECALFPAIMGTIYHLIRSDYFRCKPHMWGFIVCFALAVVVRPVEAVTELVFLLMTFAWTGWHRKIFSLRQVMSLVVLGLVSIFLFLFYTSMHFLHHFPFHAIDGAEYDIHLSKSIYTTSAATMAMLALVMGGLALVSRKNDGRPLNQPPLLFAFAAAFALILMWFLPDAFQTYVWIYRTSMGDLASVTAQIRSKPSLFDTLSDFTIQESIIIVMGIALVALMSVITMDKRRLKALCTTSPIIYLLLLVPFPLWEVLSTIQNASRKFTIAFPAIILVLLLIALQYTKWWKPRILMVTCLLIMQFLFAMNFLFPVLPLKREYSALFGSYIQPYRLTPNPHDEAIRFFNLPVAKNHIKSIALVVNPETMSPVDPYLLGLMSKVRSLPYVMGMPYYGVYSDENITAVREHHDAVFVADNETAMVISAAAAKAYAEKFQQEPNPILKMQYRLLYYYSQNKLDTLGFKVDSCTRIKALDGNTYRGCLLTGSKPILEKDTA